MQIDTQKALNELREKMLLEQAEMQSKHENEIKDSRKRFDATQQDLEKKLQESQS